MENVFELEEVNWIAGERPEDMIGISVQIRYNSGPVPVKNILKKGNLLLIELEESTRAITPGQSGVFYKDNMLLGGGIIK